jgi:hypothetical protein
MKVFRILESRKYINISLQGGTADLRNSGAGEDVIISFQVKRAGFWTTWSLGRTSPSPCRS